MSDPDQATVYRQACCSHKFIKPWPTSVEQCVHCGVSAKVWEERQTAQAIAYPWGGMP